MKVLPSKRIFLGYEHPNAKIQTPAFYLKPIKIISNDAYIEGTFINTTQSSFIYISHHNFDLIQSSSLDQHSLL